tara:strand:+ start:90 stop:1082 length:993 start_codon:yes stop_codon:yes gene_type:complete
MKNNSNTNYGKFSKNHSRDNSESKYFSKNKSRSIEKHQKNSNKSKNNKFLKNNNVNEYKSKNNYEKSSKSLNEIKILQNNNQFREKSFEDFIWGKHSVLAALESNRPINRIWCTSEIKSSEKFFILLKEIKKRGVLVEEVSWPRISQITRGAVHQGIALQVSYTKTISLEKLISLSKLNKTFPVLICLDGITDPHNVGAIIRSAEAFGCSGVILPQRRSAGITGTVSKVAAGALENLPISRVVNLNRSLQSLKDEGFLVVGLSEKAKESVFKFAENAPIVIVVGSENKGISLITQKYCDNILKIPLIGKTNSLNASVAAGICISHLTKIN